MLWQEAYQELEIRHPWVAQAEGSTLSLAAGRFTLYDRQGHTQAGLSLGGRLSVTNQDDLIVCEFISDAPIFLLQENQWSPDVVLADEVDSVVARRRAAWGTNEAGFAHKMAAADPLHLLAGCLAIIETRLKRIMPHSHEGQYADLERFIHHIRQTLIAAQKWPYLVENMDQLL